jgi:pyruvate formate lyase activating enzyme
MSSMGLSRRDFLKSAARGCLTLAGLDAILHSAGPGGLLRLLGDEAHASGFVDELLRTAPPARFWLSADKAPSCQACHPATDDYTQPSYDHGERVVKCFLCAQGCLIGEGEKGHCRARMNIEGELRSLVYGRPISVHIDPIEKKPFFHFLPGRRALSMATAGCPLSCKFCQNWELSQANPEDYQVEFAPPNVICEAAGKHETPIIAFTYNEPTVFTEYLTDIARQARAKDVRSVLVSCGFMTERPLTEMCETLDAIKIDLKGFSNDFYRDVCGAELEPVLRSIRQVAKSRAHLEIVNLVVPTLNDSDKMLADLVDWVLGEVGPDVPVHFTRFHPDYQLRNLPPTPLETLERARNVALNKGLHYPFVGNVPGHPGNSTYCPKCGEVVIKRYGFFIQENHVKDGRCSCGTDIAGVWS